MENDHDPTAGGGKMTGAVALEAKCHVRGSGRRTLALLLHCITCMAGVFAQGTVLQGTVSDEHGRPVPFVNIAVVGSSLGTTSDGLGRFAMRDLPPGDQLIAASSVGHATTTAAVHIGAEMSVLDITLRERVVDLPVFTVQSSMTGGSGPVRDVPGSAWYIGPREIQRFAYTDPSRLLRTVPGVQVMEEDGFGLRPNIGLRGAGAERSSKITVMEDGILVAPAPYAAPAAYYFPTVGRMHGIEVVQGSSQVRHGPLTTGGAINLLSTPVPEASAGQVALWGGSFGMRNLHAHAGTTHGGFGVLVESFLQGADGFKELDGGGPTGFAKQDHLAKLQWQSAEDRPVRHAVSLRAGQTIETSDETYLGLTLDDFGRSPYRRYAASAQDRMEMSNELFSLRYAVQLANGPTLVATAYRTNTARNWYKLDAVVDGQGDKVSIARLLQRPGEHADALALVQGASSANDALQVKANQRGYQASGIQLGLEHTMKGARAEHHIEAGVRLHSDLMDRYQLVDAYRMDEGRMLLTSPGAPGTESNRVGRADALAAHLLYRLTVGRVTLHPGVRHEHITLAQDDYGKQDPDRNGSDLVRTSNTVDVLIPGFGMDVDMGRDMKLFAGVHRGFSPPGTDPRTRPESSLNSELGLRIGGAAMDLQVIAFHNAYDELLGSDMAASGGMGTGDLFNGGRATVQGIELFLARDLLHAAGNGRASLPLSVSYTYTDARFGSSFNSDFGVWGQVVEGDRIPYIAGHQINARLSLEYARTSFSLNVVHMGGMPAQAGPQVDDGLGRIDAFTVVDLAASRRLATGITAFATVQNVMNDVYLVSLVPAGARPGMPRSISAGMRFQF